MATASIWVDADACPKVIKDILFRAAERTGVTVTLVANQRGADDTSRAHILTAGNEG